jgi:hypothetical protein
VAGVDKFLRREYFLEILLKEKTFFVFFQLFIKVSQKTTKPFMSPTKVSQAIKFFFNEGKP